MGQGSAEVRPRPTLGFRARALRVSYWRTCDGTCQFNTNVRARPFVVQPDEVHLRVAAAVLGAVSVACHTVTTQEQCIERIASHDPFDLILLVSPLTPLPTQGAKCTALYSSALATPLMQCLMPPGMPKAHTRVAVRSPWLRSCGAWCRRATPRTKRACRQRSTSVASNTW